MWNRGVSRKYDKDTLGNNESKRLSSPSSALLLTGHLQLLTGHLHLLTAVLSWSHGIILFKRCNNA